MTAPAELLDLRGLRCPWPALRLARALRSGAPLPLRVIADDPAAPAEMRAVAEARGLLLEDGGEQGMIVRAPADATT